ncbi:NAD(P)/FAD-dependent oxidoreductase [Microbaculum marinisediminis]|uniref:NAD(P)/FAD-dependent oxidoreductase n=1 Tax=Microbaculum marinisediminis TaxID=2931392 RepID=A0AAW5R4A2_9HYPH|nr:NAD(P)/FAD-dependent oxidoreductase [Microbaculum sp. A6E488]MCT8974227.1 NAD(P)/FAD-dependent oxidoreductase [Microbaculum sp. A6E488]
MKKEACVTAMCQAALVDEEALFAALRETEPVPLALVHATLTGDSHLIDRVAPHVAGGWSFEQSVPEDIAQDVVVALVDTIRAIADGSLRPQTRLDPQRFARLLGGGIGCELPDGYAEMMLEEMHLAQHDERTADLAVFKPDFVPGRPEVVIVGAGLSGICLGIKLHEQGVPFTIYEKNMDVGGTWLENHYPGAGVDIPSHFYSFSFARKPDWTHHFAKQDEILAYLRDCATKYGIVEHIRFGHEVESASWDESASVWRVRVRDEDGQKTDTCSRFLVSAVGQLNRPSIPDIEGLDTFKGVAFHTARWPSDLDLDGKRCALVGTGASAVQVGPAIADRVASLTVFQRSPNWVAPNANYHKRMREGEKWALANIPFLIHWYRWLLFWASGDTLHDSLQKDPDWPHKDRSLNADNEAMRERLLAHIQSELGGRQDLIDKATPNYPPYGKRMLRDTYWYRMLRRENVELVDSGVTAADETGLIDGAGKHHDIDVCIFSTGFKATEMLAPMRIEGAAGRDIHQLWGPDDSRAYLGVHVPGFPNFFVMYGPNTNLAHGGSLFFHAECQTRHIMQVMRELYARKADRVTVRQDTFDAYNAKVDAAHGRMVWTHEGMSNWYRNSRGRVVTNSPWKLVDYWRLTHTLDPSEFEWAASPPKRS